MGFRFRCPKCNTTSFSIERDQRSYAPRGQTHELIFSCRCGRQLFGDAIEAEYLRQKAEWEASATDRKRTGADRSRGASDAELDAAYERQRAARLKREQEEAQAQETRRLEEDRVWRERVAQATADDDDDLAGDDDADDDATPSAAPSATRSAAGKRAAGSASRAEAHDDAHDDHDHDHDDDHSLDEDSEDAPSGEPSDRCEWKDCQNPPRPNSKYCSRDCSNKNARSRYKRRRGRGREAA